MCRLTRLQVRLSYRPNADVPLPSSVWRRFVALKDAVLVARQTRTNDHSHFYIKLCKTTMALLPQAIILVPPSCRKEIYE
jgi:hypothetical protein